MHDASALVTAWEQTIRSTLAVGRDLAPEEFALPTECPGCSVQDQFVHIASVERLLLGEPIDERRGSSPHDVLDELEEALSARSAALRGGPLDAAEPTTGVTGNATTLGALLADRTFDCWIREQDVRRATGRPGGLDSPAAVVSHDAISRLLPTAVGAQAAAPAGSVVTFDVGGELPLRMAIMVGADGRAWPVDEALADGRHVAVAARWETFSRLVCGRIEAAAAGADLRVGGDEALAAQVLAHLALAP